MNEITMRDYMRLKREVRLVRLVLRMMVWIIMWILSDIEGSESLDGRMTQLIRVNCLLTRR